MTLFVHLVGAEDADIVDRTVVIISEGLLDAFNDVEALGDFAEDGVLAVEMRRAAHLAVEVHELRRHRDAMVGLSLDFLSDGLQLGGSVGAPPDDIELTTAGATFGIGAIALASHRQGTTLMGMEQTALAVEELALDGVVGTPLAQRHARLCTAAVRVAALNHETLDDTMEEQRVVELLVRQTQEVITMLGGIVVERQQDVSLCGFQTHLTALRQHRNGGHQG